MQLIFFVRCEPLPRGPDTLGRYLVLRPLRRYPPTGLGALVSRCTNDAPGRLYPAELVTWEVFASYHHPVGGVPISENPSEDEGCGAPPPLFSLRSWAPVLVLQSIAYRHKAPWAVREVASVGSANDV